MQDFGDKNPRRFSQAEHKENINNGKENSTVWTESPVYKGNSSFNWIIYRQYYLSGLEKMLFYALLFFN